MGNIHFLNISSRYRTCNCGQVRAVHPKVRPKHTTQSALAACVDCRCLIEGEMTFDLTRGHSHVGQECVYCKASASARIEIAEGDVVSMKPICSDCLALLDDFELQVK